MQGMKENRGPSQGNEIYEGGSSLKYYKSKREGGIDYPQTPQSSSSSYSIQT